MEGYRGPEYRPHILQPQEDGSFDAVEFEESLINEVAEIREEDIEIDATLKILDNSNITPGLRERMKNYLYEIHPELNWELYLDIVKERTIN